MSALSQAEEAQLKAQLQDAVVSCTERCLYNSAKWYAAPQLVPTKPTVLMLTKGCRTAQLAPRRG